ncbi:UvrD-helicase domain-containing protein [Fervidobacterium pennivorans]|uniref:UvrD-helicase domain-containing protein n=1 Tax=Fervidobacterium pennivorans TaxID=93466 RepID=UPI001436A61C|nr:UvrD-helicase domain-containing protein [Fervidobacterium pennivorans]QIV78637.1 UvrD-helicase domain-containing protein [Fervidobacterium pennivorans subsp. keratinolyticus]
MENSGLNLSFEQKVTVAEKVRKEPNKNYFISASAGTGKTFTLTNYYIGILEQHEQTGESDIVDRIVAVTFTNKAANEMKDRIVKEIQKKLESLNENDKAYKYWKDVYKNMSRAIISTIDSFCRRILIEQNIEAGVDPNFKIINELKQKKLIDKATQRAIQLAFDVYDSIETEENYADKVTNYLYGLTTERAKRIRGLSDELAKSKEDIFRLFEIFGDISEVAGKIESVVTNWRLELNESKVSERLLEVFEEAGGALRAFRNISLIAAEFYESETLDNFEYDFKGVLEKTLRVLENSATREYYQKRFKYIIVDEFQDTNELQKKIFDLIHTDNNYIFYVGDRKQSIYRFRGGDVSVFIKTMNEFEEKIKSGRTDYEMLSLNVNYRSHPELIDYFNYISENTIFNNHVYEALSESPEKSKTTNNKSKSKKKDKDKSQANAEDMGLNDVSQNIGEILSTERDENIYIHEVFRLRYPELYQKLWFIRKDDESNAAFFPDSHEFLPGDLRRVNYVTISKASFFGNTQENDGNTEEVGLDEDDQGPGKMKKLKEMDERELEAFYVAKVIKSLVGKEMTFYEKQDGKFVPTSRKITFKDFAILSYKLEGIEDVYREVFAKEGIPLYIVKGRGFYRRPEIKAVISALYVIQNPNSNYYFTQFFFTPFTDNVEQNPEVGVQNGKVKIFHKIVTRYRESKQQGLKKSLFQCAKELAEENELPGNVTKMIKLVAKYDELKYYLRPAETLKLFVKESGYLRKIAHYPNSSQRLRNVRKLLEQATEFDDQAPTFFELTRLLERISEVQEVEASEISEEEDVVRMMTIHASKGLEFNIVFLVNNDGVDKAEEKTFFPESEDGNGRYVYISQFLDKALKKFETSKVTKELEKELKKLLEAEIIYDKTEILRKVYVAITRAKEMLFVVDLQRKNTKGIPAIKYLTPKGFEERIKIISSLDEIDKLAGSDVESVSGKQEFAEETSIQSLLDLENVVDKGLIFSDFTPKAYKRYISPTLLYGIKDEKSDLESVDESSEDFDSAETISITSTSNFEASKAKARLKALNSLLEKATEITRGKQIHSMLASITKYEQLKLLVEKNALPEDILNVRVLESLFNESEKIFSEWRLAKSIEIYDEKLKERKNYILFGVPDKVFLKDGEFYVVDFKSTDLYKEAEEIERYMFQVKFYMMLLSDFGKVHCGYLVSVPRGQALRIDPPGEDFLDEIIDRIKQFEELMSI